MLSSLGWGEIMVLLVAALFIFGPDRLPSIVRDASGALKKMRGFITGAREQIREEFGDEFADLDLGSLNPREFVRRQLLDDDPPSFAKRSNGSTSARAALTKAVTRPASTSSANGRAAADLAPTEAAPSLSKAPAPPLQAAGDAPPYDYDAT